MDIKSIISDSVRYPFSKFGIFVIVGILFILTIYTNTELYFLVPIEYDPFMAIISFVALIFISGYGLNVINNAIRGINDVPSFSFKEHLVYGLKSIVVSIVYLIIPFIAMFYLLGSALASLYSLDSVQMMGYYFVPSIIVAILFVVFGILLLIAICRLADTGELGQAFKFGEIISDIKRISITNIIIFLFALFIIDFIASAVASILMIIPTIGWIVSYIFMGGFSVLFFNRALGLLYQNS